MCRLRFMMLLAAIVTSLSCGDPYEWSFDEVSRVTDPSSKIDAVLVETNGGATTSFGYEVFVVPKGGAASKGTEVVKLYGAVRSKHAYGANLKWDGPNKLAVEYLEARSAELRGQTITIGGEQVSLVLYPGVNDPAAAPGGMLYNLRKQ